MKIFAWICVVIFIVFALLQLNDPDPVRWALVYLCAAGLWGTAAFDKVDVLACAGLAIIVTVWMCVWSPGFIQWIHLGTMAQLVGKLSMDKPYIEEAREFLGLGLILLSAAYLGIWRRQRTR
jgi:hypothetical protein